jgi:sterol desaturase/sphingolipid hydroxylase (fatty acid hydroxylase superfamily)
MPTPLQLLLDPVAWIIFAGYAGLLLWEALRPARPLPHEPLWRLRGFTAFAVYFLIASYLPMFTDAYLARWQLIDLHALGTWGGAAVGLLVAELGIYAWHRALHGSTVLWRGLHQWHHSAERIDAASAFWFSPLDMVGWTLVSSISLVLLVGLTPEAATLVMLTTTFLGIYQHTNVRTPRWTGYLIQRPEQHRVHHARDLHAFNYCDLAFIDMLFGTWRNPADHAGETGFHPGASRRLADLLLGRDLSSTAGQREADQALVPLGYRVE